MDWIRRWIEDFRWVVTMVRVRRFRQQIGFQERLEFDSQVRPQNSAGMAMDYPDAVYHLRQSDFERAVTRLGYIAYNHD